jgi:NAD(P)H-dependent FMN reductase
MNIVTLSGSLRAASLNTALLRVVAFLAPAGVAVTAFDIGTLPLFNPDLEAELPVAVARLHAAVVAADALIIASPEYAHGVTGAIKNALDWLVGLETFAGTPVAVLNASPRALHADAALRETLVTMSAHIVESASIGFALLGAGMSEGDMARDASIAASVATVLAALRVAVG